MRFSVQIADAGARGRNKGGTDAFHDFEKVYIDPGRYHALSCRHTKNLNEVPDKQKVR